MLHPLDDSEHLRANIATAHALQVTPGSNAGFVFKPTLEVFRERATVRPRVGDEDPVRREIHPVDDQAS